MYYDQSPYRLRCEWGEQGLASLVSVCDLIVIVDVLSFSTCVDIVVAQGVRLLPYGYKDRTAEEFARSQDAICAAPMRTAARPSLSPASLQGLSCEALVLPSPNGAHLSTRAGDRLVLTSYLRNARATAEWIVGHLGTPKGTVGVIAAGERWEDGSTRFALEDLIGAGALLAYLDGDTSPEAEAAIQTFEQYHMHLADVLIACSSGRELTERGFREDVILASELNVSDAVANLMNGAYINVGQALRPASI